LLRDPARLAALPRRNVGRADVVVLGGGVSGLSAAWRLSQSSLDVRLLDLEGSLGGTSTFSEDGVVPHPWGAHYLPVPNTEARATLRLLSEMGVITGFDALGQPKLDSRRLVHAPDERIFYKGAWHPGLIPFDALTGQELGELDTFLRLAELATAARGKDGRPIYNIPLSLSSADSASLELDAWSMADWLSAHDLNSPFLRWFVRYATLDDFGADPEETSAWAGLHYFAARKHRSEETAGSHYLVWPEGNGALVKALQARLSARVETSCLGVSVRSSKDGVTVGYLKPGAQEVFEVSARGVVLAVPSFIAQRLIDASLPARVSSPWLVANLHVRRPLAQSEAWDSVIHGASGLGYVDASHQLTAPTERTVLTYFRAYGEADVARVRAELLAAGSHDLATSVLEDLRIAQPQIGGDLERIELVVWGHAMPRPSPGFLASALQPQVLLGERVTWGHVDQAAMGLFEEAQFAGVRAAEALARALQVELGESWL
jgi:phytoene dehydrogenase-like protein